MLTIRDEQWQALREAALLQFEIEMVGHLQSFAPQHAKVLGPSGLQTVVRHGHQRASGHLLTLRGTVRFYIEMIFMFGAGFDTDPQYPWAAQSLRETNLDELRRADRLHADAIAYIDAVSGPDDCWAKVALRRIRETGLDFTPESGSAFAASALSEMHRIYPEKCAYVGQAALESLIDAGARQADELGAPEPADRGFCIGLMFALGHGYATDPHMPWISNTLAGRRDDGPRRLAALRGKVAIYLDAVLKSLENG
jgi:hypothetical protein